MLSLYAKGLTTGEISAHFAEIYGASISRETVSRITEKVVAEMAEWATRPLDAVYVAVFIDAIMVKVRDGQVANRPVYAAIGVTVEGCKDVLGLWAGHRRRGLWDTHMSAGADCGCCLRKHTRAGCSQCSSQDVELPGAAWRMLVRGRCACGGSEASAD